MVASSSTGSWQPIRREYVIAESDEPKEKDQFNETDEPKGHAEDSRESVWAIVSAYKHWYLGAYIPLVISGEVIVIIRAIGRNDGIIETWYAVIIGSAAVVTMSVGLGVALAEFGRQAVVLAHTFQKWVDKKFREWDARREAKARAKGREENQMEWEDWYASWKDAQARGEEFDEPPPNGKV